MSVALLLGGFFTAVFGALKPHPTTRYSVIGAENSGKSSLVFSIQKQLAEAHLSRVETLVPGPIIRSKISIPGAKKEDTWWIGQDWVHWSDKVPVQILKMFPKVIFIVIDHEKACSSDTDEIIMSMSETLASRYYRSKTSPLFTIKYPKGLNIFSSNSWTRMPILSKKRCTNIIVIDNKIDTITGGAKSREKELKEVFEYYFRDDGPLRYVKDKFTIQFIGLSTKHANFVPLSNLGGEPQSNKILFKDLVRRIF